MRHLFAGMHDTLLESCLDGIMGKIYVDNAAHPTAAYAVIGDFAFVAGDGKKASALFCQEKNATIIVPQNAEWGKAVMDHFGTAAQRIERYKIKHCAQFDRERLTRYAQSCPYPIRQIDAALYEKCMEQSQFKDFCALFDSCDDFLERGLGYVVLDGDSIVAGASSYAVFKGGIEIEVDTAPAYRRKGLALGACATLILSCLDKGLYPSWDAANMASVKLCEHLGYTYDHPYVAYEISR